MRAGLILALVFSAFLDAGCSQGVGDRCVQDSDCASGICSVKGQSAQGGKCLPANTGTVTQSGGSSGQAGQGGVSGEGGNGQGGIGGTGGAADAASPADAAPDAAVATDANRD
jgi:hypothetical protein